MGKNYSLLLLTLVLLFVSLNVSADPITRSQAQQKAEQMMQKLSGSRKLAPVKSARLAPRRAKGSGVADETELYYVFNRGDGDGYVIVAGDDQFDTFLGYTDEGEFDYQTIPPAMKEWLDDYADYIESIQQAPASGPKKLAVHPVIEPMVTTKWNQGDPYNQHCPNYFHQGVSVTGCVATAMAQILYYQRAKSVTEIQEDIPSYNLTSDQYGTMTVNGIPAGSPIEWDYMRDTYNSSSTAKEKAAVADLMLYCGVSVRMGYTNKSSGAYSSDVPGAINKYFGYGNKAKYASRSDFNDDTWDALIYKELSEGRPVYLSGHNDGGGHAFVCDGYDGNMCYHINWGWGGSSDGHYMLSKLNPGSQGIGGSDGGYSNGQGAVYGLEPDNYMSKAIPISNSALKKICVPAFDANEDGVLTYGEVAEVKSLGDVFKGKTITAFPELYYFTGLTELDDNAFEGCSRLASIKLPKGLKRIGANAFANCRLLKTLQLPDNLTEIGDSAFMGCRALTELNLPAGIKAIEAHTFDGCAAFTSMELPLGLQRIEDQAFANCSKLTSITVKSVTPQRIKLGADVFEGTNVAAATLKVLQGTGDYFRQAEQWSSFGTIYEQRSLSRGQFSTLETKKPFYLYNVGTGCYLTRGEAHGTQAIIANTAEPMRFEFRTTTTVSDAYYLYSNDTGSNNHNLFRTSTDSKVGSGVKACFVDGANSAVTGRTAHWNVELVEGTDNVYTLQIPSTFTGYVATEYFGVQPSHESNAASPTYGVYSDIDYATYPLNCQWMLVPYEEEPMNVFVHSEQLRNLLAIANNKKVDASTEQIVYDNLESTAEDIDKACVRLRKKLNLIQFQDDAVRKVCIANFDMDLDNEVSYTEVSAIAELGSGFSGHSEITAFPELEYFTHLHEIDGNGLKGLSKLTELTLPTSVVNIYYQAFQNCTKLERIHLSESLELIGANAFTGCSALKEVYLPIADPSSISLGSSVFPTTISKAVLYVPEGSKELYAEADIWKGFGEIREMRALKHPGYVPLMDNTDLYVYNKGMKRFLARGEAYGTQAVVDKQGLVYQLRRSSSMASGTYYLYSEETGKDNKVLFRTDSDGKVGSGVKACFVDGTQSAKAYWSIKPVQDESMVYTFQVPQKDETYVEGEYLGTDYNHETDVQSGTYGIYWDVSYDTNPENCQWAFVSVEAMQAARDFFNLTEKLRKFLEKAEAKSLDVVAERAVYNNFSSTEQEITDAIESVLSKLQYISFIDSKFKNVCDIYWDADEDGEISKEEAAAVTDLSVALRNVAGMKSLEDLRYFTGITEIPAEGIRSNSSLISVILPEGVKTIGEQAFASCSNIRYLALLNDQQVVSATNAGLSPSKLKVFVPKNMMEAYQADEEWGKYTILEYTGVPTVTAVDTTRVYGTSNPSFTYEVTGAPINGIPTMHTDTDVKTPAGSYPLTIEAGTITTPGVLLVNGTLTVAKAPLVIKARSYTREYGQENPEFKVTYRSFKNSEKETVLLELPTIECDATPESPAGEYEIRVFGAEAENYDITYENGILTVTYPDGVEGVDAEATKPAAIYDLGGRKVNKTQRGVFIIDGKKGAVKE